MFLNYNSNIFRNTLKTLLPSLSIIKTNKKIEYYNVESAFDTETSSFYENYVQLPEYKRALMYAWGFGIKDIVFIGRTWEEYIDLCFILSEELKLSESIFHESPNHPLCS